MNEILSDRSIIFYPKIYRQTCEAQKTNLEKVQAALGHLESPKAFFGVSRWFGLWRWSFLAEFWSQAFALKAEYNKIQGLMDQTKLDFEFMRCFCEMLAFCGNISIMYEAYVLVGNACSGSTAAHFRM